MSVFLAVGCGLAIYNLAATTSILLDNLIKFRSRTFAISWISLISTTLSVSCCICFVYYRSLTTFDRGFLRSLQLVVTISNFISFLTLLPLLLTKIFVKYNLTTTFGKTLVGVVGLTIVANTFFMMSFVTCILSAFSNGFRLVQCPFFKTVQVTFAIKAAFDMIMFTISLAVSLYMLGIQFRNTATGFNILNRHSGSLYVLTILFSTAISIITFTLLNMDILTFLIMQTILTLTAVLYSYLLYTTVSKIYALLPITTKPNSPPLSQQQRPIINSIAVQVAHQQQPQRAQSIREGNEDDKSSLRVKGSLPCNTIESMAQNKIVFGDRRSITGRQR